MQNIKPNPAQIISTIQALTHVCVQRKFKCNLKWKLLTSIRLNWDWNRGRIHGTGGSWRRQSASSKTRTRRLEGFSGEKEVMRIGRRGIRVRNMRSFDIFDFGGELRVFGFGSVQRQRQNRETVWDRKREFQRAGLNPFPFNF